MNKKVEKWKHILKKEFIIEFDRLKRHPSVREVVIGPYDYICFEFYNESYIYTINNPPRTKEELKKGKKEMDRNLEEVFRELDKLIFPLDYGIELIINNTIYITPSSKRFDPINHSGIIAFSCKKLQIKLTHTVLEKNSMINTRCIVDEWYNWGKEKGYIDSISIMEFRDNYSEFNAEFSSNISELETVIAFFIAMLTEHKKKTKITLIYVVDHYHP